MIPKTIHQIWLGDKKMPWEWMETWKIKNPLMRCILWNEDKIKELGLINQDKFDYFMSRNIYHGAADIARVEILERNGGVYIDADSICLSPIEEEEFMLKDFWGVQEKPGRIANGIIGSIPHHPILVDYIKVLAEARELDPPCYTVGAPSLTKCIKKYGDTDSVVILPTCSFLPEDHYGKRAPIVGKIFAKQYWGTTNQLYKDT